MKLMHAIDHGFITHRIRIQKFSHSESEVTLFSVSDRFSSAAVKCPLSLCVCESAGHVTASCHVTQHQLTDGSRGSSTYTQNIWMLQVKSNKLLEPVTLLKSP